MIDEKKLIEEITAFGERMTLNGMQGDFHLKIIKAITDIIEKQSKVGEWIPCSERLPSVENKEYLTCKESGVVMIYTWSKGGWNTFKKNEGTYSTRFKIDDVVAWQPLPEPYRKDVE